MIFKSYEINKINFGKTKFILIYGSNEGHKKEIINEISKKFKEHKIDNYDEKNILSEPQIFYDNILSKSFFEKEKLL